MLFRVFEDKMKLLLGMDWSKVAKQEITYGNNRSKYVILTFIHAQRETNLHLDWRTHEDYDTFSKNDSVRERYSKFNLVQSDGSHFLEKHYRRKLLIDMMKIGKGDCCLEIGCGIPRLALDMAGMSGALVVVTELGMLLYNYQLFVQ